MDEELTGEDESELREKIEAGLSSRRIDSNSV